MKSHLFPDVSPLPLDPQIEAFIREQGDDNPYPGATRGTAVLNADGKLYRAVLSDSPIEASRVADFLVSLGLIDRVGFDNTTLREVDSLTRTPLETKWSGVFQLGDHPHPIPPVPRIVA